MARKLLCVVSFILGSATAAFAQAPEARDLVTARELYTSARYDEALAVLNGMRPADASAAIDRKAIEQYRSLCLLALGRGSEAEAAIAAVVTADPLFKPSEADASPRVRGAFSDVRQKLLPDIAAARYATAKATFDRKEYADAERQFKDVMLLLDDPQMNGKLTDMRVLVKGFLDLSVAAAAPPPAPKEEPKKVEPPAPKAPPTPDPAKVYTQNDEGVVAPVVVRQDVPRVPANITSQTRDRGVLDLTIDEQGRVIAVAIRVSLHVAYDPLIVNAAKGWRYKPATLNGVPVKFRKMIQVAIER